MVTRPLDDGKIYCDEPSLTQQSPKDECDINCIVERAKRGADLSKLQRAAVPMYGDFTNLPSYRDALLMVNKARAMFAALDARVRERFANDPGRMLDFLADESNREEGIKLGLIEAPVVNDPNVPDVQNRSSDGRYATGTHDSGTNGEKPAGGSK